MELAVGEKNEIRNMLRSENKKASGRLFKLYNSQIYKVEDIFFVLFNMSLLNKKQGNIDSAKIYIKELKDYMIKVKDENKTETNMTLWLYIDIYKNELNKQELLENYILIYESLNHLGEYDEKVLGIEITINILKNNYTKVIELFHICLKRQYIDTIKNTLEDLHLKNVYMYNKLLEIKNNFNKYDINVI